MSEFTKSQYYAKVEEYAKMVVSEAMDTADNNVPDAVYLISDLLLEEVDSSQYAIYTFYHLPIIQYSDNEDYYIDNFGSNEAANVLKEKGLSGLHAAIAFWAFYADIQDKISNLDFEEVAGLVVEE